MNRLRVSETNNWRRMKAHADGEALGQMLMGHHVPGLHDFHLPFVKGVERFEPDRNRMAGCGALVPFALGSYGQYSRAL
jgi:hypothetical protein